MFGGELKLIFDETQACHTILNPAKLHPGAFAPCPGPSFRVPASRTFEIPNRQL